MSILKSAHPWGLALLTGLLILMALWLSALAADPAGAAPKKGKGQAVTVDMDFGMVTLKQSVTLEENKNRIRIQGLTEDHKQWTIKVEINLTKTKQLADRGSCTGTLSLRDMLVDSDSSTDRFFLMQVDKRGNLSVGFPSGGQKGHRFSLHWHELSPSQELEELDLRFDTPTVRLVSSSVKTRTFKFTGGTVKVRKNYSTTLECDNLDDILVTVKIP